MGTTREQMREDRGKEEKVRVIEKGREKEREREI